MILIDIYFLIINFIWLFLVTKQFDINELFPDIKQTELDKLGITEEDLKQSMLGGLDWIVFLETNFKDPMNLKLPLRLYKWQKKVIRAFQWGDKDVIVKIARQYGKSTAVICIIAAAMICGFGKVGNIITPPTEVHVMSITDEKAKELNGKVVKFIKNSNFSHYITRRTGEDTQKKRIRLINGSRMVSWPPTESIRGESAHILVFDEMSRIKDKIILGAARSVLTTLGIKEIGVSTPFGNRNVFARNLRMPQFYSVFQPVDDPVNARFLIPSMTKAKFEKKWIKLGAGIFAEQEMMAKVISSGNLVFRQEWIQAAYLPGLKLRGRVPSVRPSGVSYVMGVDLGRHRDRSVIIIAHALGHTIYIDWIESYLKQDYDVVRGRIKRLAKMFPIEIIVPDGTGVGEEVIATLMHEVELPMWKERKSPRYGYYFTRQTKQRLIELLAAEFAGGRISMPFHKFSTTYQDPYWEIRELERELLDFEFELDENNPTLSSGIKYGVQQTHDDRVDALGLVVVGIRKKIWQFVGEVNEVIFNGQDNKRLLMPKRAFRSTKRGLVKGEPI